MEWGAGAEEEEKKEEERGEGRGLWLGEQGREENKASRKGGQQRRAERRDLLFYGSFFQMPSITRVGPCRSPEPGVQCECPVGVTRNPVLLEERLGLQQAL